MTAYSQDGSVRHEFERANQGVFLAAVNAVLAKFLDELPLAFDTPELTWLLKRLRRFILEGGKRALATYCYWGFRGASGAPHPPGLVTAAAGLEMLQACALLQDDIVDRSPLRRGQAAMPRQLTEHHVERCWGGSPDDFGISGTLVLSDLCLSWTGTLIDRSTRDAARARALRAVVDEIVRHAAYGTVLELIAQAARDYDLSRAFTIAHHKCGRYMFSPALRAGGIMADASVELQGAYAKAGVAIGEAFQFRNDILDIFRKMDVTGKAMLDDVRQGTPTVLVAYALRLARPDQIQRIRHLYGNPEITDNEAEELRVLFRTSGAVAVVEKCIDERTDTAVAVLRRAVGGDMGPAVEALVRATLRYDR
ncbi:polyprenyl synthetase family protein [Pendulispora brunnea]|uniref:Polyprenyl synthetase family protein n=1 Tax=Pendulispora brunnea TaxID=2905690 RepID=A0ABZ2JXG5_9BACT